MVTRGQCIQGKQSQGRVRQAGAYCRAYSIATGSGGGGGGGGGGSSSSSSSSSSSKQTNSERVRIFSRVSGSCVTIVQCIQTQDCNLIE